MLHDTYGGLCKQTPLGTINIPGPNPGVEPPSAEDAISDGLDGLSTLPGTAGGVMMPGMGNDMGPQIGGGGGVAGLRETGPLLAAEFDPTDPANMLP